MTIRNYYNALSISDKTGKSTVFIEYMLDVIDKSLGDILNSKIRKLTDKDRLEYFLSLDFVAFSRKDYMNVFRNISSATASRDLREGVEMGIFKKAGNKNKTIYTKNKKGTG